MEKVFVCIMNARVPILQITADGTDVDLAVNNHLASRGGWSGRDTNIKFYLQCPASQKSVAAEPADPAEEPAE